MTTVSTDSVAQMTAAAHEPTRADRRRDKAASIRYARYKETGFAYRAAYMPFVPAEGHPPFTAEELMGRAARRRDAKRTAAKAFMLSDGKAAADAVFDNRAPHALRGTPARKHLDHSKSTKRRIVAFWRGVNNNISGFTADGRYELAAFRSGHRIKVAKIKREAVLPMAA